MIAIKDDMLTVESPDGSRQEVKSIVDLNIGDFCLTQQNIAFEIIEDREAKALITEILTINNSKKGVQI